MQPMKNLPPARKLLLNLAFLAVSAIILVVLLEAPKETTAHLPHDEIHRRFYEIEGKKQAEQFCLDCHGPGKEAPLSADHPPKYRCLFCHKRT